MNNFDKLKTRIIVGQSVGVTPDEVRVIDAGENPLYILDNFKEHNLALCFDEVPTIEEAREKVKDLYLCGVEWDFDEDMRAI